MLSEQWENYLDMVIPHKMRNLIVYTDKYREWLAIPLVDHATDIGMKVSMALTDEYQLEDVEDIARSLSYLSPDTLLVAIISDRNPNFFELVEIFPYYRSLPGFDGYSITCSYNLPDAYLSQFLRHNYDHSLGMVESIQQMVNDGIVHIGDITIEGNMEIFHPSFKIDQGKHVSLPGTELKIAGDIRINGKFKLNGSVGPIFDNNNMIDYMGLLSPEDHLVLTIKDSKILAVDPTTGIVNRIEQAMNDKLIGLGIVEIQLGIGPEIQQPGLVFVDRNTGGTISLKTSNRIILNSYG